MRVHDESVTLDLSASGQTSAQDYLHGWVGSVTAVWTGTPTGTLQPQVSNDGSTWFDSGTGESLSGSAGAQKWDLGQFPYKFARMKYTRSSGTGSSTVHFISKGV